MLLGKDQTNSPGGSRLVSDSRWQNGQEGFREVELKRNLANTKGRDYSKAIKTLFIIPSRPYALLARWENNQGAPIKVRLSNHLEFKLLARPRHPFFEYGQSPIG